MMDFDQIICKDAHGQTYVMSDYCNQVLLVVNVASRCYFRRQYPSLVALYEKYNGQGLEILAFPCNQFAQQEPASAPEVARYCDLNFQVPFPVMEKVFVNGPHTHPIYAYLKRQSPGVWGSQSIKWNFCKFLVAKDRSQVLRFAPMTPISRLEAAIEKLLGRPHL